MRSPAAAIAWELGRRHRWGWCAICAYLLALAATRMWHRPVHFTSTEALAFTVLLPLTSSFLYLLGVFTFGSSGDIAARDSMYPRRLFTLPVGTAALAGWPMVFGSAAAAMLWIAFRFLVSWPPELPVPGWWPALLAASIVAWTQALTWMPYPLPGLRVIVAVVWLTVIDVAVLVALQFQATERLMFVLLAPQVPIAYCVARFAVGRARRGDAPEWRLRFGARAARTSGGFRSASRAQRWFEWRQFGRTLPALVALLLPFELGLLFLFHDTPSIVFTILLAVLFTPAFMCVFVAATVRNVSSFMMTRPIGSLALIAAKLEAAFWSTLLTWLVVVAAIPVALRWSGAWTVVAHRIGVLSALLGPRRLVLIAMLALALLVAFTWAQLVQSLYLGMSGRAWMTKASVFVALAGVTAAVPLFDWLFHHRAAFTVAWHSFPWLLGGVAVLKIAAGASIAARLHDRGLLGRRALVAAAIGWNAAVFAVYAVLAWGLPAFFFRSYFLTLVAVLAVPLVRLSAAPLALAWNRHR